MRDDATRTLLVTGFAKTTSHHEILDICRRCGEVREYFTLQNKYSVLFLSFYDISAAEKAAAVLASSPTEKFLVKYSIAKCEIPKGTDACTEEKHQGSVSFIPAEEIVFDSLQVRDKQTKNNELVLHFFDSRHALKFFGYLSSNFPRSSPRLVWDNDLRRRRQLLQEAEDIVKHAPLGYFKGGTNEPVKRAAPVETRKKLKGGNWMLSLFDKYIANKAQEIAQALPQ